MTIAAPRRFPGIGFLGVLLSVMGTLTAAAAAAPTTAAPAADTGAAPNILLLVADDLGYAELGVQGGVDISTPHIDALAREGVRFTAGYVTCPVCSPSRAGMMTGRYQDRFGHEFNSGPAPLAAPQFGLPLDQKTLADRLHAAGYATGLIGKWHLGYREELWPLHRGFDFFYGFIGGAHDYLKTDAGGPNPLLQGTSKVETLDYTTDEFGRQAVEFIRHRREQPWFLEVAFNAVHAPLEATPRYLERVAQIANQKRRTYVAMTLALDEQVGAIMRALKESGAESNTLVVFISDNGGPTGVTTSSNRPLRGFKNQIWEGGIRIPWIMRWPSRIAGGRQLDTPVISLDLAPTMLNLAGVSVSGQELDGVDLMPWLSGQVPSLPERSFFWRYGEQRAVRRGQWKLTDLGEGPMLFDLQADLGEQHDRAREEPGKLRELEIAYAAWDRTNLPPRWPNPEAAPSSKPAARPRGPAPASSR